MGFDYYSQRWDNIRASHDAIRERGGVHITQYRRHIHVVCPFNPEFAKAATALGGSWRDKSGMWSFRVQSLRMVYDAATKVFGWRNITGLKPVDKPLKRKGLTK